MEWGFIMGAYATSQRAKNMARKTIRNREECILLLAAQTGKSIEQITHDDLLQFLTRAHPRTGREILPSTKESNRSYLRTFFRWARVNGYRSDDPAESLESIRVPKRKPRPFRADQVDALMESGSYKRTRDLILILVHTGLRVSEVVKIRGEDIDWEAGTLTSIRKGNKEHTLKLHPEVLELARQYPRRGWWFPSPYKNKAFPNGGGHILGKSLGDVLARRIDAAGIDDSRLTGHSTRHTFGTNLAKAKVPLLQIKDMMGHESVATTQIYTLLDDDQWDAALQALPRVTKVAHAGGARGPKRDAA